MIEVLAFLLIGLAVADWLATFVLIRAALALRDGDGNGEAALDERATAAMVLTVGATCAAIIAIAYLLGVALPDGISFLFLAAGLIALSVPQIVWALAYVAGRFQ